MAIETRRDEFKQEVSALLAKVVPKGAVSICLVADADKVCRVSKTLHPDEFTIKIRDIEKRGYDVVFDEAWGKAIVESGRS